jgi:membrane associated rhomboid family serine protease
MFLPLHDTNPIKHVQFPYVTYGLIALNAVVFLFEALLPERVFNETTFLLGFVPVELLGGEAYSYPWLPEWATLVTYAFLHADWLHLGSNMLFLWIFGDNIEDAMGHVKFLVFYLLCAVLAALAHMAVNPGYDGPLIGASGAVSGVMGAYILLFPHARVYVLFRIIIPIPLPLPAIWMLGVWIATQIFNVIVGGSEPIAWWAHLGGVAAGALLAVPFKRPEVEVFGGR